MATLGAVSAMPCAVRAAAQKPQRALKSCSAKTRCTPCRSARLVCRASGEGAGIDPMQGFGGREIRVGEIESNFGEKVWRGVTVAS